MLRTAASTLRKMSTFSGQKLDTVVEALEKFAPLSLAERWDNVGLLVEPHVARDVKKILLTNDLTEPVMKEAIDKHVDMIISYHPPIFKPLTRITQSNWKERIVAACLANSIALYSPHTSWDKLEGGINDWLAKALTINKIRPLVPEPGSTPGTGSGRLVETNTPIFMIVRQLQDHIENNVHVALAVGHHTKSSASTVAICAGSGATLLRGVRSDVIITGEMSHHELLEFNHNGTTVLLCNHSNSERGYLHQFKLTLSQLLNGACEVIVSEVDKDPLSTSTRPVQPKASPADQIDEPIVGFNRFS